MKTPFALLGFFFLMILHQFEPLHSQPQMEMNDFQDAAIGKMKTSIAKHRSFLNEEDADYAEIIEAVMKCIMHPAEIICNTNKMELNDCLRPLEIIFSRISGTRFEGFVEMLLKALSSVRDYICNTRYEDLFEMMNPCINYELASLTSCWKNTTESIRIRSHEEIINAKEEYCKALEHNAECTLNMALADCQDPDTIKILSEMYKKFFIDPCHP
ncbi:uncharacterized protein LOC123313397 [Coccinella septempunctata]|uniref:uncharacterized protein LOC123313397 n=1 Tax=Coccinella septempunctata TaxID=41139 RepID=UPI001D07A6B4|nr:uncharacterized protein LOC123313397 [Coccinella septempunctata]